MCENMYDMIIVGSGPAGLTAGIYGKRAGLKVVILESGFIQGGQIVNTYEVDNYPGMPGISGLELAEKDFEAVSDGQRQRVLLARAICQEPQVIVLDEPTAFLDIRHKLELLYLLKNMVREKKVAVLMSLHELDLAQKISDHIICVKGDNSIGRFGTPEEIFSGDYIKELFQIEKGTYLTDYGSVELEAVKGEPKVFVIGGNGSGIPVYRKLQRQGIPFAAGVLHENDLDYPVAKALAVQVISERPYEPIGEAAYEEALRVMEKCRTVICSVQEFGSGNLKNADLLQRFMKKG